MAKDFNLKIKVDANSVDKATGKIRDMGNVIKGATRPDPVADMATYVEKLGASAQTTAGKIQTISSLAASFGGPWGIAIAAVTAAIAKAADAFDLFGEKAKEAREASIREFAQLSADMQMLQLEDMMFGTNKAKEKEFKAKLDNYKKQLEEIEAEKGRLTAEAADLFYTDVNTGRLMAKGAGRQDLQWTTNLKKQNELAAKSLELDKQAEGIQQGILSIYREQKQIIEERQKAAEKQTKTEKVNAKHSLDWVNEQIAAYKKLQSATPDIGKQLKFQAKIDKLEIEKKTIEDIIANKKLDSIKLPVPATIDILGDKKLKPISTKADTPSADWMENYRNNAQALSTTLTALSSAMDSVNNAYATRISTLEAGNVLTKAEATEIEKLTAKQNKLAKAQLIVNATTQALAASESVLALIQGIKTATATSKSWIEAIVAVASTTAAVVGAIATAKSYKTYATGGIVGGNSRIGDMQTVRVNSGEMILSGRQQKQLFSLISAGRQEPVTPNVSFRIEGRDLVGVMDNYSRYR